MPDPLTPERIAEMHARNAVTAYDANWSSDVPDLLAEVARLQARVAALEEALKEATTPDLFWDGDDPEEPVRASTVEEAAYEIADPRGNEGWLVTVQCAKSLPTRLFETGVEVRDGRAFTTVRAIDAARKEAGQ